jgi:hypothetical protein
MEHFDGPDEENIGNLIIFIFYRVAFLSFYALLA